MKTLYESVISADTQRRLGEYYTPDVAKFEKGVLVERPEQTATAEVAA
jgi:hypothetical protein